MIWKVIYISLITDYKNVPLFLFQTQFLMQIISLFLSIETMYLAIEIQLIDAYKVIGLHIKFILTGLTKFR